jgi:DNA-directed RNA polymerase subunit M/transcription elongation factor TFIIS
MGTVEVQEKCAAKEKAWEQRQQTRADETQASREGCGLRYPPAL